MNLKRCCDSSHCSHRQSRERWCPLTSHCFCASYKLVMNICSLHEENRGSDYHHCCLPNNNESMLFIFMDSSVFDHLPLLSRVSSSQGHITWFSGPSKGLAWLQLSCAHGQVSSWYKEVLTYNVSDLKSFVAKQLFSNESETKEKWWCLVSLMLSCGWPNSDQDKKTQANKKKLPKPNQKN